MREKRKSERGVYEMFTDLQIVGLFRQFFYLLLITVFVAGCTKDEDQENIEPDLLSIAGIARVIPMNLTDSVAVDPIVSVTFNQETDQTAIAESAASLTVKKGNNPIPGNTTVSGTTITYVSAVDLTENTVYSATITAIKKNSSGHSESHNYTWKFKTGKHHRNSSLSVVAVEPLNKATAAPVNSVLAITFNHELTTALKGSVTIDLKKGTSVIQGTLSFTEKTAIFTPSVALSPNAVYNASLKYGKVPDNDDDDDDNDDSNSEKNYTWSFTTSADQGKDVTAPTVISAIPTVNATSVATSSNYRVTFSEPMNTSTITSATILLKKGTVAVAGTVTYSGTTATFTPSAALDENSIYTGTVTTGVKDVAGNALAGAYTSSFTTATVSTVDNTAPTVVSVVPAANATSIALNSAISANFSEAMGSASITSATFTLKQGTTVVAGAVTYSGTTAKFTPTAALTANTLYTATITTGAKDVAGNAIAANYIWSFTTGSSTPVDNTAPTVVSVVPAVSATSIALNSAISANFSEAMGTASITSATFTLKQGTTAVAGTVTYSGTTAKFTPTAALAGNTVYTATITTGAKDVAGNAIAANYIWSFTTVSSTPVDNTAPTVVSVVPGANATSIALNSAISANFSEAMGSASITSATFTLKQGTTAVAGTVTYSGTTAKFTPTAALTANTLYTATITTGAKDVAGNAIAANYTWSFTTLAAAAGLSFATDVVPVLNTCNACHTHNWTTSANASTFYTNLVSGGYVNAASPTTSKLYTKINGGHPGSSMTTAEINKILNWMTEGSKNN